MRTGTIGMRGLGGAMICPPNGACFALPSTPDPSTPLAPATQYVGPVGGFACNAAGGYSLQKPSCYQTSQCMTAAGFAAAQLACAAGPAPPPPIPYFTPLAPNTAPGSQGAPIFLPQLPPAAPPVCTTPACLGLSTPPAASGTDFISSAMAWVQNNALLAGGLVIGAFLLFRAVK
jgi:hypothetical protein